MNEVRRLQGKFLKTAMRNEKELPMNKDGLLGNAEGPITIGEQWYLVTPVSKVLISPDVLRSSVPGR